MSINYTKKELLKPIDAGFSIWNSEIIAADLIGYVKAIVESPHSHLMLIILPALPNKINFNVLDNICKCNKIKNHGFVTIQYQTVGTGELKPIAQIGLLVSNNLSLEPRRTSWFREDIGLASNVWDLTPNNSLFNCKEDIKEVKFGFVSFDLLILMQQLASPLSALRFNYIGKPSKSVIRYGEKVLNCNIAVD